MALKPYVSFSAGELDPALRKRTTLEKYNSGLATNRNAIIGKTGRWITRGGRLNYAEAKTANKRCILYAVDGTNYLLEWGHQYVRVHDTSAGTYQEVSHTWTEDDLDNVHFDTYLKYVYCFCSGKKTLCLEVDSSAVFLSDSSIFFLPAAPTETASGTSTPPSDGYDCDYSAVAFINGQPSAQGYSLNIYKLPTDIDQANVMEVNCGATKPQEVRFYRRPYGVPYTGAFGYVGSVYETTLSGGVYKAYFRDPGIAADYSQQPPVTNLEFDSSGTYSPPAVPLSFLSPTGCFHQHRLLLVRQSAPQIIEASRPGFVNNFYRNIPVDYDSALSFKIASGKNADVKRFKSTEKGLVAFTSRGVYVHSGLMSPSNLGFDRRGGYVIDEKVPPLEVPDGVLFVDKATNTVRSLAFSDERQAFTGEEISIFSNHLFEGKRVRAWDFQDGDYPIVWVVFDDGSCAALTYQSEQQMKAWARHDGVLPYEHVAVLRNSSGSTAYFVVNKNGTRYIEKSTSRYVEDLKDFVGVDGGVTLNGLCSGTVTVTPVVADDWTGQLTVTSTATPFANTAGNGAAGSIFRIFDSDGSEIDLEVDTYGSTSVLTCSLVDLDEYPSDEASAMSIYKTYDTVTGLSHLNGEEVSILCDGYVVASPNNNLENFESVVVSGGSVSLPGGRRGAIIHVGRPYTCDFETLDVATVEQRPVSVESMIGAKIELSLYHSRGIYVGQRFPDDDKLEDDYGRMEDVEQYYLPDESEEIIANRPMPLQTRDVDVSIEAEWKSRGRICIRQVDPLPAEIIALNLDLTDLRRGR